MLKALRELRSPTSEVPICALIVRDNNLISKAINQTEALSDASAHAEIIAIREASEILKNWRLTNCTLYTTLEPCSMCAGAILNSRISKIVFSAYDLNSGACGSVINLFYELGKQKQIEIIGGILENEASKILKEFFKKFRNSST
ncbi:MAG: nucleoside deaminase [Candidatus Melainabacteria bacterium]|nr:nucleoside deaminase [Candidatus Melainabacteria bacterium]